MLRRIYYYIKYELREKLGEHMKTFIVLFLAYYILALLYLLYIISTDTLPPAPSIPINLEEPLIKPVISRAQFSDVMWFLHEVAYQGKATTVDKAKVLEFFAEDMDKYMRTTSGNYKAFRKLIRESLNHILNIAPLNNRALITVEECNRFIERHLTANWPEIKQHLRGLTSKQRMLVPYNLLSDLYLELIEIADINARAKFNAVDAKVLLDDLYAAADLRLAVGRGYCDIAIHYINENNAYVAAEVREAKINGYISVGIQFIGYGLLGAGAITLGRILYEVGKGCMEEL